MSKCFLKKWYQLTWLIQDCHKSSIWKNYIILTLLSLHTFLSWALNGKQWSDCPVADRYTLQHISQSLEMERKHVSWKKILHSFPFIHDTIEAWIPFLWSSLSRNKRLTRATVPSDLVFKLVLISGHRIHHSNLKHKGILRVILNIEGKRAQNSKMECNQPYLSVGLSVSVSLSLLSFVSLHSSLSHSSMFLL